MTGLVVGLIVGWVVGLVAEFLWKQNVLVMIVGGLAGLSLGGAFEAIRFRGRMRRFHATRNLTR